jgi:hypothetical protein
MIVLLTMFTANNYARKTFAAQTRRGLIGKP